MLEKYIKKLEKEKKELKQENEQLITELNSYKSRKEKAVEYIESRAKMARVKLMPREEELLNILNGRSDE